MAEVPASADGEVSAGDGAAVERTSVGVEVDVGETAAAPAFDRNQLRRAVEAVVMVAEEPLDARLLAELLAVSPAEIDGICVELAAEYDADARGFALARVGGGWRFQSHESMSSYVERLVLAGQTSRLSSAALETLSIVAYKQPISRTQVSAIRGVNVDGVMRTLQQRGYVAELARDSGPGQAILYGTTRLFLEKLGINALDELPPLGDFVPGPDVVESLEDGLRFDDSLDGVLSETAVDVVAEPSSEPTVDAASGGAAADVTPAAGE